MNSLSDREREVLEQECIALKAKYPDKCAVIVESKPLLKFQMPLESNVSRFIQSLKEKIHDKDYGSEDIEVLINRMSPVSGDKLFMDIFDAYAFRDKFGKEPLYLYVGYRAKQSQDQSSSWFGLW